MPTFFNNILYSRYAFWIGFAAGVLFWWLYGKLRDRYPAIKEKIRERIQITRQGLLAGTEARYRGDVLRKAQRMHLAAPLFSLDEILEPVGVITQLPSEPEENGQAGNDQETLKLPYLPDWPEFGAAFHWPVLALSQALEGGANLILLGNPGSGKTVALASLASQLAAHDAKAGTLSDYLPLLVHVADLSLSLQEAARDPFDVLLETISTQVSALTLPRLNVVIRNALESGKALLLMDGLDEFPPDPIDLAVDYLTILIKKYPKLRLIVAASPSYYDGLAALGFAPVAVSAWNSRNKSHFTHHWGELWDRYIVQGLPENAGRIDSLLLNGWLSGGDMPGTPLELTLRTWAAYAGDSPGAGTRDSIEAYISRMTAGIPKARPVLEKIASVMLLNANPVITVQEAEKSIAEAWQSYPAPDNPLPEETSEDTTGGKAVEPNQAGTSPVSRYAVSRALPDLVDRGLLVERKGSHISFLHPVMNGYLASSALSQVELPAQLHGQPQWAGKQQTMQYLASCKDISNVLSALVEGQDDPLQRNLLLASRWLQEAPKAARWRSSVMRQAAMLIQNETLSLGLRARLLTSLVLSNDPGVPILMRQL
ncbi:MAG: NACHT domain-containing protein, partial [Omnitrophica WOR_2 bacterium]